MLKERGKRGRARAQGQEKSRQGIAGELVRENLMAAAQRP